MRQAQQSAVESGLARACVEALVRAARSGGTRQQVRAAARRLVRRHRRDHDTLRWILRSVGASSALALALLGLGAEPGRAELPPYGALTGSANPLDGQDVGITSAPALGDLDGDGDFDVVSGAASGFKYFENTGTATSPAFVARTGAANPLAAHASGDEFPEFGDLDGDGDLDLLVLDGTFRYFENTGDATAPAFVLRTGAANPLNGQPVGTYPDPALGDLDADGDLDLLVGQVDGTFRYFENTGGPTSPAFLQRTGGANLLGGHDVGDVSAPALADVDSDGDLDVVAGTYAGTLVTFENTGSATSPVLVSRTGPTNPLNGQDVGSFAVPAFGDLDADGDPDLVVGDYTNGLLSAFENRNGRFTARTGAANPMNGWSVGSFAMPSLPDLDADGDLDLVVGTYSGEFIYFANTGSAATPAFTPVFGAGDPFNGLGVAVLSAPSLGDLDGDGDLDLLSGDGNGAFHYFRNSGSAASPAFVAETGSANPLNGQSVPFTSFPAWGDLDADGDLDLVAGSSAGTFHYFENTGSPASPSFVARTGAANPLDGEDVGIGARCALGDVDGDGDLDLVSGEVNGTFRYFENNGTAASPDFVARSGTGNPLNGHVATYHPAPALGDLDADGDLDVLAGRQNGTFSYFESFVVQTLPASELLGGANPLAGRDVGLLSGPAFGDVDGDGDPDLLAGEYNGTLLYFRNTGDAVSPAFLQITGSANPLFGVDIGLNSAPALGDLDGDGDLDLVVGELYGVFFYFENTGDALAPAFVPRSGSANPLDGADVGTHARPALADLDADGDLDVVAGEFDGVFDYLENTGDAVAPAFVARTGTANPLHLQGVGGARSSPALGDFDRDGDLDLAAGDSYGAFHYWENQGSATAASFVGLTGGANPLAGEDVGASASPAPVDLDGDGDVDLVAGAQDGLFHTYYFPEPARALLLGAGIALLQWLGRVRRRAR